MLDRSTRWACPLCTTEAVTVRAEPHTQMHRCSGLKGLLAPMVEAHEREDYVGTELVQTDGEGRPIMAVVTTRDDGQDCTVFAPTATAEVRF